MANYSITSLYSGSKGNSVLIESDNTKILIDAGKSARALCNALSEIGKSIDEIDAIFITHEHNDHIGALEILLKKHKIPVHIVEMSAKKLLMRSKDVFEDILCLHTPIFTENIGNMKITSFPTPHDSEYSVGYRIEIGEACIGYATDIGYITKEIKVALSGCESVVLECNHDEEMLLNGSYPYDLKLRIRSKRGHLSNHDCAEFASDLCLIGTKNILLAHLSEENNDPDLAFDEVWSAISDETVNLKIASQYQPVKLI
ncbi:MAG: MBL fold metallo-hydrolase [Clostridia bacterium]|nr:MBL fold metallo-hydrolase [Clostridia bacterium]